MTEEEGPAGCGNACDGPKESTVCTQANISATHGNQDGARVRFRPQIVPFEEFERKTNLLLNRPRFLPVHWKELDGMREPEPLIEGVLDVGSFSTIIGQPGSYKTGHGIDLAAHVATGISWRGRKVRQGTVLYVAAEGGYGFRRRLAAWRQHHQVDLGDRFFVIIKPIDLVHGDDDTRDLIRVMADLGKIDLVVIDTLSRAMAGGDENSSRDLGVFVRHCDLIRNETGAHVCVLHHQGKDPGRGARGHSLLFGAVDTELTTTKADRIGSLKLTKYREGPDQICWGFAIELVDVGNGKTSYVVVPENAPPTSKEVRWTKSLAVFRDAITNTVLAHGKGYRPGGDGPLVKAVALQKVRAEHNRLFLHSGDGDRSAAQRQAWNRALKEARAVNLIGGESSGGMDFMWLVTSPGGEKP
jgi:hypothetical protein